MRVYNDIYVCVIHIDGGIYEKYIYFDIMLVNTKIKNISISLKYIDEVREFLEKDKVGERVRVGKSKTGLVFNIISL